jgi:hypothetical protein
MPDRDPTMIKKDLGDEQEFCKTLMEKLSVG